VIFFTAGTHEDPFHRLVRAADACAQRTQEKVLVQRGHSQWPAPGCAVFDLLPSSEFERLIKEARVVVTHAGPSTIDRVLQEKKVPIVFPRQRRWGEHVDDHQVWFARRLHPGIPVVLEMDDLPMHLESPPAWNDQLRPMTWVDAEDDALGRDFGNLVEAVLSKRRDPNRSVRATLRTWIRARR